MLKGLYSSGQIAPKFTDFSGKFKKKFWSIAQTPILVWAYFGPPQIPLYNPHSETAGFEFALDYELSVRNPKKGSIRHSQLQCLMHSVSSFHHCPWRALRAVTKTWTQPVSWASTWRSRSRITCTISRCWQFTRFATIARWRASLCHLP